MYLLQNLPILIKSYRYISIPSSISFIIQSLMIFTGLDQVDESENYNSEDEDKTAFHVFSFRNLINFLFGFSWTGILFDDVIESSLLLLILSFTVGIFVILLFYFISLQTLINKNKSFKITDAINKTAKVYVSIPENKQGTGKIIVVVKGQLHELEVMTENNTIESGTIVKVEKIANNILIVKPIYYK